MFDVKVDGEEGQVVRVKLTTEQHPDVFLAHVFLEDDSNSTSSLDFHAKRQEEGNLYSMGMQVKDSENATTMDLSGSFAKVDGSVKGALLVEGTEEGSMTGMMPAHGMFYAGDVKLTVGNDSQVCWVNISDGFIPSAPKDGFDGFKRFHLGWGAHIKESWNLNISTYFEEPATSGISGWGISVYQLEASPWGSYRDVIHWSVDVDFPYNQTGLNPIEETKVLTPRSEPRPTARTSRRRRTAKPAPAPTPALRTPSPAPTPQVQASIQLAIGGVSMTALNDNPEMKWAFKGAIKESVVESFNTRAAGRMQIHKKNVTVALREMTPSTVTSRRLEGSRRLQSSSGGVIVDATIAMPASSDIAAVNQVVSQLATPSSTGGASILDLVMSNVAPVPNMQLVMIPGATLSAFGFAVTAPAVLVMGEGAPPAPTPPTPPARTMGGTNWAPALAPALAPIMTWGLGGLPCGYQAAAVCTQNTTETCRYDESCSQTPPWRGGLGCNAGGVGQNCRFCGFKEYLPCDFDPNDKSLPCGHTPKAVCAGPEEPCYMDRQCTSLPPGLEGLGCNAGGVGQDCRFCGFGHFPPCPYEFVM